MVWSRDQGPQCASRGYEADLLRRTRNSWVCQKMRDLLSFAVISIFLGSNTLQIPFQSPQDSPRVNTLYPTVWDTHREPTAIIFSFSKILNSLWFAKENFTKSSFLTVFNKLVLLKEWAHLLSNSDGPFLDHFGPFLAFLLSASQPFLSYVCFHVRYWSDMSWVPNRYPPSHCRYPPQACLRLFSRPLSSPQSCSWLAWSWTASRQ